MPLHVQQVFVLLYYMAEIAIMHHLVQKSCLQITAPLKKTALNKHCLSIAFIFYLMVSQSGQKTKYFSLRLLFPELCVPNFAADCCEVSVTF